MTTLQVNTLTSEQRDAFIRGWQNAGGYMDDADSPCPWCAPWTSCDSIDVEGETLEEMGADYWEQCREEINSLHPEE